MCVLLQEQLRVFILTLIIAAIASVLKLGWCLISSSTAFPKFLAVSPMWSAHCLLRMADKYSGEISTLNNFSKGLQATNDWSPRVFKHMALKTLGSEDNTSLVAGIYKRNVTD